ncbi:MAG: glycosyltransferase family 2 protein [Anaerohalosphaera sp.]|nr:glycosyltransferase family 2 protein [Anaerohalosphaera sp.]
MKMIIQIPCYNEEENLATVIADLPREVPGIDVLEYLIIDDGCTDNTVQVARDNGVHHVLSLGTNKGLAVAFMAGLHRCVELGADVIVNTDGDHQYQGKYAIDCAIPIIEGKSDIVVGIRPIDSMEYFSWLKKKAQRLGSYVVRQLSGTDIPDATSGFRAYSKEAALKLHVFNPYDYALENIIQAGHMGMRISHVPIDINPKTRVSRLFKSEFHYVRQSIPIILRSYIIYKPLRTFLYCSVLPGLLGLILCVRFLWHYFTGSGSGYIQSLILAAIMLIISALLMALGVFADLISANRRLMQETLFQIKKQNYISQK